MTGRWPRHSWRLRGNRPSRSCPLTRARSPTLEASRARVTTGDLLLTNARLVMRDETVLGIARAQRAGLLRCEHFLHLRCEVSTEFVVEDVAPLAGDALVRLASLMDHSPGQQQFESVDQYRAYNQGRHGLSDAQIDALIA